MYKYASQITKWPKDHNEKRTQKKLIDKSSLG